MLVCTDPLQHIIGHLEQVAAHGGLRDVGEASQPELMFFRVQDLEEAVGEEEQPVARLQSKRILAGGVVVRDTESDDRIPCRKLEGLVNPRAEHKRTGVACAAPRQRHAIEIDPHRDKRQEQVRVAEVLLHKTFQRVDDVAGLSI